MMERQEKKRGISCKKEKEEGREKLFLMIKFIACSGKCLEKTFSFLLLILVQKMRFFSLSLSLCIYFFPKKKKEKEKRRKEKERLSNLKHGKKKRCASISSVIIPPAH